MTGWYKSTYSHDNGCVEVHGTTNNVLVRDSKLGDESPVLHFTRAEMAAWIKGCKAGEFDDLT